MERVLFGCGPNTGQKTLKKKTNRSATTSINTIFLGNTYFFLSLNIFSDSVSNFAELNVNNKLFYLDPGNIFWLSRII